MALIHDGMTLLFQGDSVTDCGRSREAVSYTHLRLNGYKRSSTKSQRSGMQVYLYQL